MATLKKILFPTDFSKTAGNALSHALRLADFHRGELIVQHVVTSYFEPHSHWATIFDVHELQKHMDFYVETEMGRLIPDDLKKDLCIRRVISKGKPEQEISTLANQEMVDLIVMAPAKGVITGKVIRLAHRPVLAVPLAQENRGKSLHPAERILVATDFSDHSKKLLNYAFGLKKIFNSDIYMLYVIETTRAIEFGIRQGHFTDAVTKMKEWAANQLVNLTPDEFITDPSVHRIVDMGPPSDRIAGVSQEVSADLVVLGAHERGAVQKYLIGTTTNKVLTKVSCPVLAVKI